MKCPICDVKMKYTESCIDVGFGPSLGPVEESLNYCPNGHYTEEFDHGSTRLSLWTRPAPPKEAGTPDLELIWSYNEEQVVSEAREKLVKAFCEYARTQQPKPKETACTG